jgi:hypothetical protein
VSGITVITTTQNQYEIATGTGWTGEPTVTGELYVNVYATAPDNPVASFGNVEVVYRDDSVVLVTEPAPSARGL